MIHVQKEAFYTIAPTCVKFVIIKEKQGIVMNRRLKDQLHMEQLLAVATAVVGRSDAQEFDCIVQHMNEAYYEKGSITSVFEVVVEQKWDQGWDILINNMPQLIDKMHINDILQSTRHHPYQQSFINCLWEAVNLQSIDEGQASDVLLCLSKEYVLADNAAEFDAVVTKLNDYDDYSFLLKHLHGSAAHLGRLWFFERFFIQNKTPQSFFGGFRAITELQNIDFISSYIDLGVQHIPQLSTTQIAAKLCERVSGFDREMYDLCSELNINTNDETYEDLCQQMTSACLYLISLQELQPSEANVWHDRQWRNIHPTQTNFRHHVNEFHKYGNFSFFDHGAEHHPEKTKTMIDQYAQHHPQDFVWGVLFNQGNDVIDQWIMDSCATSETIAAAREKREILSHVDDAGVQRLKKKM